ncbi:MAG: hypothetical protein GZ094_19195 [Mariniphaga sp.]|nr:hypothetical protein [Mariniphaga sp.]
MTIRTFWIIFIKILGIWLVLSFLTVIPQFAKMLTFFGTTSNGKLLGIGITVALFLLTIGIYALILRLFVFKTDWLIDKLHLDKGFPEEKIELNIQRSTVFTIATIVIGGFIFADSFPLFCQQVLVFIQRNNLSGENPTSGWIIFYLVKTILGYLLMTNSQFVVRFLEKQNSTTE